ncbi:MAG: hypothetical protein MUC89_22695 [Acetobacteraceae bacterium]|jgi:hypothetical protein|nr:hypothetical protein [Acetobacteraceae bacterium]
MSQTICRIYATRRRAEAAAAELRLNGYGTVDVFGDPDGAPLGDAAHITAMTRAGVARWNATEYAARIAAGNVVVAVYAPFGRALMAERILQDHEPLAAAEAPRKDGPMFDEATPMSNILGLKPLAEGKLPFESMTGLSSLARGWFFSGLFGMGFGRAKPAPFSSALGLPTLTKGATPLSSMTGMATLSANATPLSSALGLPVLKSGTIMT